MNLIEQLGGYEKAKDFLNISKGAEWIGVFYMPKLKQALLQYRREHNIFEEDDLVVIPSRGNGLFSVSRLLCRLDRDEMRHATPEEIQAGRRL